ncbi:MAG: RNA polymerase sigma factor [Polyangiales bacterium]
MNIHAIEAPPPNTPSMTFREVFEKELHYVWNTLRRLGVKERDLEDLAHEVFLVVHRKFAEYDATRPLRPWLFGIAFRCSADYRRLARHRHELLVDAEEPIDARPGADEQLVKAEARGLLSRALESVDDDRRAVLLLHDFEEFPMATIAETLSIPLRTGYSRLRVGREELTAAIRRLRLQQGAL